MRQGRALTLVEVLVVLGIVAALAALLSPVLARARRRGRIEASKSAMRAVAGAALLYGGANDDALPDGLGANCYSLVHRYGKYCGTFNAGNGGDLPSFWKEVGPLVGTPALLRSGADVMDPVLARESGHQATWWRETELAGHPGSSYEYALGGPDRLALRGSPSAPLLFSLFEEDPSATTRLIVSRDLSVGRVTGQELGRRLTP